MNSTKYLREELAADREKSSPGDADDQPSNSEESPQEHSSTSEHDRRGRTESEDGARREKKVSPGGFFCRYVVRECGSDRFLLRAEDSEKDSCRPSDNVLYDSGPHRLMIWRHSWPEVILMSREFQSNIRTARMSE